MAVIISTAVIWDVRPCSLHEV